MELKEIKCQNCGAKLEVGMDDHEVTCQYCNARFTIDDEYSKSYKTTKGMLDAQDKHAEEFFENHPESKNFSKIFIGFFIVVFLSILAVIIYQTIFGITFNKKLIKETESIITSTVEKTTTEKTDIDPDSFNYTYETIAGSTSYFFLSDKIDAIITNNKKNENHQITITYGETTATTEEEMVSLKSQIKSTVSSEVAQELYVSYTYDDAGYITNMKVLNQA